MYKVTIGRTTILTCLDKRRETKTGLFPIRIQVYCRGVQKYYKTGKELSIEDWDKLPNTRLPELVKIRNNIKAYFDLFVKYVEELVLKGGFSFQILDIKIGNTIGGTLNFALSVIIEKMEKEGRIGTMRYYKDVLVDIEKFGGEYIPYNIVTIEWLHRYENDCLKKNLSYSTIGMRMRGIRVIMNKVKKAGLISESQYPFGAGKYEIKTGESRKKALTMQQIAEIVNFSDGNETTEFYRDIWLFIYLCNGINVADLVKMKFNQIVDGEIHYIREKTKRTSKVIKEIKITLTSEMQKIIDRWGNKPHPNNYIFNLVVFTDDLVLNRNRVIDCIKKINTRMKMIGNELGIGDITTYTARHSFATVLKRSGINISYISESLGHKDLKTTENYLASFEKDERQKNAELLMKFDKSE